MTATRVLASGEVRISSSGRVSTTLKQQQYKNIDLFPLENDVRDDDQHSDDQHDVSIPTTQVGIVGRAFEQVYYNDGNTDVSIINVKELLNACQIFANVMRNTGQVPVARDLEGNMKNIQHVYDQLQQQLQRHQLQ